MVGMVMATRVWTRLELTFMKSMSCIMLMSSSMKLSWSIRMHSMMRRAHSPPWVLLDRGRRSFWCTMPRWRVTCCVACGCRLKESLIPVDQMVLSLNKQNKSDQARSADGS